MKTVTILAYKEKLADGAWVSADTWETNGEFYTGIPESERFGAWPRAVADVLARWSVGLPVDASPEVKSNAEFWGSDARGHGFVSLEDLRKLRRGANDPEVAAGLDKLIEGFGDASGESHRLVFFFAI